MPRKAKTVELVVRLVYAGESFDPPPTARKIENLGELVDVIRGDQSMAASEVQIYEAVRRVAEVQARAAREVAEAQVQDARKREEFAEAQRVRAKYGLPLYPIIGVAPKGKGGRPSHLQAVLDEMQRRYKSGPWPRLAQELWKELEAFSWDQWGAAGPKFDRIKRVLRAARRDLTAGRPLRRAEDYQPEDKRKGAK
jgi:hypothetical protein